MRATSTVTSLPAPQIPLADHNCQGGSLMSCDAIKTLFHVLSCVDYLKYLYVLRCFAVAGGCGYSNPRPRSVMLLTAAPLGLNGLIWVAWPAGPQRWTRTRTRRPMWIQFLGSVSGMAQRTSRKLSLFLRPYQFISYWTCVINCVIHQSPISNFQTSARMRCYPLRFGMRVVQIFPHLLASCEVTPECPEGTNGKTIFRNMDYGDSWQDADLRSSILYIRGSYSLKIPDGWRELLPTKIWEALQDLSDHIFLCLGPFRLFQIYLNYLCKYGRIWPYMAVIGYWG